MENQLKIFKGWRPAGAAVRVPGGRGGGVPGHRVQAQLGGGDSGAPHQPARHTGDLQYQFLLLVTSKCDTKYLFSPVRADEDCAEAE